MAVLKLVNVLFCIAVRLALAKATEALKLAVEAKMFNLYSLFTQIT